MVSDSSAENIVELLITKANNTDPTGQILKTMFTATDSEGNTVLH